MTQNFFVLALRYVLVDLVGEIIYFPIWWYTSGLQKAWELCLRNSRQASEVTGLIIWLKNIGRPMFAQYDWQGRLISFLMRIVQIFIRGLALIGWLFIVWWWLIIWLLLPVVIIYEILYNLGF